MDRSRTAYRRHGGAKGDDLKTKTRRRRFAYSLAAPLILTLASPAVVQAADPTVRLDIKPGPLDGALQAFAKQAHQQILFTSAIVSGRRSAGLHGQFSPEEGLRRLLLQSDLESQRTGKNVFVLKERRPTPAQNLAVGGVATAAPAALPAGQPMDGAPPEPSPTPTPTPTSLNEVSEVVVTGSHIRGLDTSASPVVTITRDDLRRDGDATIADALERLPQNFGGAGTPVSALSGADRSGNNLAYAQGVNLRGLGPSSTLVLIDGRRMAGTGLLGDFADVSAIPTAAVDHVEVLLDGASAIYGSDAVGGVVNVVTKRDFEGAESSVRFGQDAGGVATSLQLTQTVGVKWDGGHLLVAYDLQHDDSLPASARPYTANSDLTALGGSNHDAIYSSPGNILGLNASGAAYVPTYAIPSGTGLNLTPSSFLAGQVNYLNMYQDTDVVPKQDRNGLYIDLSQDLDARTELNLEGRYDLRVYKARTAASETILQVTDANPYFVSPTGATSDLIGYSSAGALGPIVQSGRSQSFDFSIGLNRSFGRTWRVETYAGFTEEAGRSYDGNLLNSGFLNEALGTTPDDPTTSFNTATNGFFNPYGNGSSNSKTILNFIGSGYNRLVDISQVSTFSLQADGVLFSLPGGEVKAAFGAQFRHERFDPSTFSMTSGTTPYYEGGQAYERDVGALFGELNIPIIGPANALPAIRALQLTVAGRVEHYDDVGTTANPKVGLVWRPLDDFTVRGTYGTSFRAPSLSEIDQPSSVSPDLLAKGASQALVLLEYGGNTGLKPETATTWTVGAEWAPRWIPGLKLSATWFDIDFTNEIGDPGQQYLLTVLSNPAYASLVTPINNANPADEAKVEALLAKTSGSLAGLFPASAYTAIVDARYVNSASLLVKGVDIDASYRFALGQNTFGLTGTGSYLYDYSQRQTPDAPPQQLVSTAGQPVDFRGRLIADWARGPYSAAVIINYVDSYKDPIAERRIDAWTTCDLSLSWRSPAKSGPTQGVTVTAAAQNLFDQDPPFYDSTLGFGYDPANASPVGRVASIQATKRW